MPRHPATDPAVDRLGGSLFSGLAPRIAALEGEIYPLHIGDTWMEPPPELHWRTLDGSGPHRPHLYCDPRGVPPLLAALVDKARAHNRIPIKGVENVLVTAGATGALCAAAAVTLAPGDEVLILSPHWPPIWGIAVNSGGVPVEVPLLTANLDPDTVRSALEARLTPRTAAVLVNTPSNPTGRVLDGTMLAAVADFARRNDLWIWSDEVYEDFVYQGQHVSIGSLAPERTLSVFSFSKAYGMAGYRCGYLVGPEAAVARAHRLITYLWYSVPTPSQLLALRALTHGAEWLRQARDSYREVGYRAADRLRLPRPEGSTYLFFDLARQLDERGPTGFLEDCLSDNLVLTPGRSFGPSYETWTRLCFTCAPPDVVMRGVERLARRLGIASP